MFFLYHRLYFTPMSIATFSHKTDMNCWTCGSPAVDLMHLLFLSPHVTSFWGKVWSYISLIFNIHTPLSNVSLFTGNVLDTLGLTTHDHGLFDLMLALAFQQIALNWKNSTSLSVQDWWNNLCHYHRLDIAFVSSCKPSVNSLILVTTNIISR